VRPVDAPLDLPPAEVAERHARGEVELIDVREPYEWTAGRIAGARHVELGRLAQAADALPRERPLVFYCRVGARSAMAAAAFRRAGYDAASLDGGLEAWAAEGRPLEPEGGAVAPH
jgi:rhodanese-related sulfurtransferase